MIIFCISIFVVPLFVCANIGLWFLGIRPYIHRHGRACVTAASWGYSILADLTTAYEIGKEEGRFAVSVKWLFALQLIQILSILLLVLGGQIPF